MKTKIYKVLSVLLALTIVLSTCISLFGTVAMAAETATYYVSAEGSDETGDGLTTDTAVATVYKAVELANATHRQTDDTVTVKVVGDAVSFGNNLPYYTFNLIVESAVPTVKTKINITGSLIIANNEGSTTYYKNVELINEDMWRTVYLSSSNVVFDKDVKFNFGYGAFITYGTASDGGGGKYIAGQTVSLPINMPYAINLSNGAWSNRSYTEDVNVIIDTTDIANFWLNSYHNGAQSGTTKYKKNLNFVLNNAADIKFDLFDGATFEGGIQIINNAGIVINEETTGFASFPADQTWVINNTTGRKNIITTTKTAGKFNFSDVEYDNYSIIIADVNGNVYEEKDGYLLLEEPGIYSIKKVCFEHIYDNDCDVECNDCKQIRKVGDHVYNNVSDNVCNICGYNNVSSFLSYTVSNNEATITDCETSISGDAIIPSTLGGYPVTNIGAAAFSDCSNLTSITIPDSVKSIGRGAFSNCESVTSITIPNSVTSIGTYAFFYCKNLTSITIPDGITSISECIFYHCKNLTSVNVPDSITSIGDYAFYYCTNLIDVNIPDSVESIGDNAFYCCASLPSITIPDKVKSIGYNAFYYCKNFTGITVSNGNNHFSSVDGVLFDKAKTIVINYPCGKTTTSYSIPDTVTSISDYAFYSCNNLTNVIIPDSVTTIGKYAFCNCINLTNIIIPYSVTTIGDSAFSSCSSIKNITVDKINPSYCSIDGVLFNKGATTLMIYPAKKEDTTYTIPDGVKTVADYAFYDSVNLSELTIPDSLTNIGYNAFNFNNNLEKIFFLGSIPQLANDNYIYNLKEIHITDLKDWCETNFQNSWFYYPDVILYVNNVPVIDELIIPDGTEWIGENAFEGAGFTSVFLPNSVYRIAVRAFANSLVNRILIPHTVNHIGYEAFANCGNLSDVWYTNDAGYKVDYLQIGDYNGYLTVADWHYNACESHYYLANCADTCQSCDWVRKPISNHTYKAECDSYCDGCNFRRYPDIPHIYSGNCDKYCNMCNESRWTNVSHKYTGVCDVDCNTCGEVRITDKTHTYSGDCDSICDVCSTMRETSAKHIYDGTCDAECNICNEIREALDHKYDHGCDIDCNICGATRVTEHKYNNACDAECNICKQIRTVGEHVYDNSCDTNCNICDDIREITHNYEWIIDKAENCGVNGAKHEECSVCHTKRNENTTITATGEHTYDNACDTECNVCKQIRTVGEHVYDNSCDTNCNICDDIRKITHNYEWVIDKAENCGVNGTKHEECTICHTKRNENIVITATGKHIYDNACDAECNVCKQLRTVGDHVYDNDCDAKCNICENVRSVNDHKYDWVIDKKEECGNDGVKHIECSICGTKQFENTVIPATGKHTYDNACDAECNVCEQIRTVGGHVYDNACDTNCNICDDIREITHNYEWIIDKAENCGVNGAKHEECNICHTKKNENTVITATGNHTYDNACDKVCNICETIRLTEDHKYDWVIDKQEDCGNDGVKHIECSICGTKQFENTVIPATGKHTYDNACDAECNVCKQIRTVGNHVYDNNCDTNCNICDNIREITHNYEWIIDKAENCGVNGTKHEECSVCHTKRNENTVITATGNHAYDHDCDKVCNVCENVRLTDDHKYDWIVDKQEDCGNNGVKHIECSICGAKQFENTVIPATEKHTSDNGTVTTKATCTKDGVKTYKCTICKNVIKTEKIAKLGHNYESKVIKATNSKNGKTYEECSVCKDVKNEVAIYRIKSISLKSTKLTFNGKTQKPTIVVKDSKGKTISPSYYTLSGDKSGKSVGKYKVKVTFKGKYSGNKTLSYEIVAPTVKKSSVSKLTAAKKSLKVSIKKASSVTGYEIEYSTSKKFKSSKKKTTTKTSYTIKSLKAKTTYYVRVRSYKTVGGKKFYSAWSSYKSKKTK